MKDIVNMVKSPYNQRWKVEYFELEDNTYPVLDFILEIDDKKLKAKIVRNIDLLEELGIYLKEPAVKYVEDGIYELRIKHSTNIVRIFYFYDINNLILLTNGYIKKKNKLSRKDFDKAKKYKRIYMERKKHEKINS